MFATHRNQGNSGSRAFKPKSSNRATTKTTQRTTKASHKGAIATAQHVDRTVPTPAPVTAPQQSHQVRNTTSASAPVVAEVGDAKAAETGKKILLTRREQRELARATFRRMENMVQFTDSENDVQTALDTRVEMVTCSRAAYNQYDAEFRRYEAEFQQWQLENEDETVQLDKKVGPIVSVAELRRHRRNLAFEDKEETVQEEGDIRPRATARDMKTKKRLAWDASEKRRTTERRQDRS